MARLSETSLVSWELTEKEQLEGSVLNVYQRYLIQTDLASICEQILGLTYDVTKPLEHLAQHAELTGQKIVLQSILDRDVTAKEFLAKSSKDSRE